MVGELLLVRRQRLAYPPNTGHNHDIFSTRGISHYRRRQYSPWQRLCYPEQILHDLWSDALEYIYMIEHRI